MNKILPQPPDERHLFIVRFWHEDSEAAPGGQWRGSVEHTRSGQRAHFVSLDALNAFMTRCLNTAPSTGDQADE